MSNIPEALRFYTIIGTWVIKLISGLLRSVYKTFVSIISRYVK